MNSDIALLLLREGVAGGAIYALLSLGTVLVFNITRIAFVSYGDLIAYSVLTLASIQANTLPGTVCGLSSFLRTGALHGNLRAL